MDNQRGLSCPSLCLCFCSRTRVPFTFFTPARPVLPSSRAFFKVAIALKSAFVTDVLVSDSIVRCDESQDLWTPKLESSLLLDKIDRHIQSDQKQSHGLYLHGKHHRQFIGLRFVFGIAQI